MKKTLLIFLLFFIPFSVLQKVYAKTAKVEAITPFDSNNPPHEFIVRLVQDVVDTNDGRVLYTGTLLKGYIYQTIPPKRLKQDASFIYIPTMYKDSTGIHPLKNTVCKYTTKVDIKSAAANAAYVFGSVPVMVITAGYFATEGAIKGKNENQSTSKTIVASAENVYENSPLSLIQKGDFLKIQTNQEFLLNFVFIKEQAPNYEYKPAK